MHIFYPRLLHCGAGRSDSSALKYGGRFLSVFRPDGLSERAPEVLVIIPLDRSPSTPGPPYIHLHTPPLFLGLTSHPIFSSSFHLLITIPSPPLLLHRHLPLPCVAPALHPRRTRPTRNDLPTRQTLASSDWFSEIGEQAPRITTSTKHRSTILYAGSNLPAKLE